MVPKPPPLNTLTGTNGTSFSPEPRTHLTSGRSNGHSHREGSARYKCRLGSEANDRFTSQANLRHEAGLNRSMGPVESLVSRTSTALLSSATSTQLPSLPPE